MPGKLKWAPFGPTCIKLYDLKLGIIRGIISEHAVAMGTVKDAFKLVTQLVDQRRSLSWLSHCKREKVRVPIAVFVTVWEDCNGNLRVCRPTQLLFTPILVM